MDQFEMFCAWVIQQKHGSVHIDSVETSPTKNEFELQIVSRPVSGSAVQSIYHIHFSRQLVPRRDEAIEEEAIKFGLDRNDLRQICEIAVQMVREPDNDNLPSAPTTTLHRH
ncbi:hypothetical protein [Hyphomicrobium sp.]|uniref:hypothetical protein n=1 Tax=Hyphomicrobium sp. TaxID=82 RepID=UPI001D3ACE40|nr:hypothetical protein [Hyphomicrobium sp.]MBY0558807.1 hypothetical protein [Hyphomicrobium sp.]